MTGLVSLRIFFVRRTPRAPHLPREIVGAESRRESAEASTLARAEPLTTLPRSARSRVSWSLAETRFCRPPPPLRTGIPKVKACPRRPDSDHSATRRLVIPHACSCVAGGGHGNIEDG